MSRNFTRRQVLQAGAAAGASALAYNSQPSLTDSRIVTSSCAAGAPLSLIAESSGITSLQQLEQEVVPPYPVTVNSAPPPQEPGAPTRPSGPVSCTT